MKKEQKIDNRKSIAAEDEEKPIKRPYILRIKTLNNKWHDRDEMLLHAMMQILVDFVDEECSPGNINWNSDPEHRHARKEMQRIYNWWTKKRPTRKDPDLELFFRLHEKHVPKGMFSFEIGDQKIKDKFLAIAERSQRREEKWSAEDDEMMVRLIAIRGYLWT